MRWVVFAIVAFIFLVLEVSLRAVLEFRSFGLAPSFVAVLVAFVSLFAPRAQALWACWILGLLVDLCIDIPQGAPVERLGPLVGPHALGYVFAGFLVLQVRAMLLRGKALTLGVMTVMAVAAASIVVVIIYAMHGLYPDDRLHWADVGTLAELARRFGVAIYSGLLALVLGPVLAWSAPAWGFRGRVQRHGSWR